MHATQPRLRGMLLLTGGLAQPLRNSVAVLGPWVIFGVSHVLCSSARVLGHCGLLNNYLLAGPVWAKIKSLYVVMVDKPFSLRDIKLVLLNLCKINECSGTYTFIKK